MKSPDGHTILVVEDEFLIRTGISDYLRESGYHVVEAANAAEAVAAFEADMKIDVVFSDVQMPGEMNGFGLEKWVRTHFPDVLIILTSGYVGAAEKARALHIEPPIQKPYRDEFIRERIRRSLVRAQDAGPSAS